MSLDVTAEVTKALGYAGGTALLLKLADIAIRLRAGIHASPDVELQTALRAGAEMREELRKENEDLRARNSALVARCDDCVTKMRKSSVEAEALKNEVEDLRAELRLLRRKAPADPREL